MKVKKNPKKLGFRFTPFRVTPCWGRGWVARLLSTWLGKLFVVVAHWTLISWFHVYSSLGWGTCFYAYFLLKLVSGFLPTGGEGGLHEYSLLGVWLGFYGYFPLGNGYFIKINGKKKEKYLKKNKANGKCKFKIKQKKELGFTLTPFQVDSPLD